MKRTKGILAFVLAAAMSMGPVPTVAFADTVNATTTANKTEGVLGTDKGKITIANPREKETYTIYRLFELASFADENTDAGQHGTNDQDEAYSYVINGTGNPWYIFLTTYGPHGQYKTNETASDTNFPYAILSNETNDNLKNNAYFIIDKDPITIKGTDNTDVPTYHVITPTEKFQNAWDDTGVTTQRTGTGTNQDDDGTPKGSDYTTTNNSVVQDFAQEALKYASTNQIANEGTLPDSNNSYEKSNLPLGYYLVGTTMGTLAALDTTNKDVDIYEKNDEPTLEKMVLKKGEASATTTAEYLTQITGAGAAWVKDTDADVGDYVMFRTVITAQQGAKNYELHDVMEPGLTFIDNASVDNTVPDRYTGVTDHNVKVYLVRNVNGTDTVYTINNSESLSQTIGDIAAGNYVNWKLKKTNDTGVCANCDFEVIFKDATESTTANGEDRVNFLAKNSAQQYTMLDVKDGDKIVVTYWAQLNENAHIFDNVETGGSDTAIKDHGDTSIAKQAKQTNTDKRNTNNTVLTYGEHSYTKWDDATVTTYQFDIVKTNEYSNDTTSLLSDAKFSLYKAHVKTGNETSSYSLNNTDYVLDRSDALVFEKDGTNNYLYKGDVVTATTGTPTTSGNTIVNQLTSDKDNKIHLTGLEAGTYILVEDTAPNGYNKLAHPIVITIKGDEDSSGATTQTDEGYIQSVFTDNNGTVTITPNNSYGSPDAAITTSSSPATYTSTSNGGLQVVNKTGQELPSTGGIGTTIFYVAGGVLLAGSVIALIVKRRMATEE